MKKLLFLLGSIAWGATTTISDTLTSSVGGAAWTGRITVTLNAPGSAQPLYAGTTSLAGWQGVYCVGVTGADCTTTTAAGVVTIVIWPTDQITPGGTSYTARYQPSKGSAWSETWVIATANTKLYEIRSTTVPTPTTTFTEGQLALSAGAIVYGSSAGVGAELALGTNGYCLQAGATAPQWGTCASGAGSGTVTSVSVTTANGVSGSVATATTTPAITLALGAITPTSVAASGNVTGANLSGTNTGDQTNITGNAGTATALATARAINGVNFDGTAAITVTAAAGTLTGSTLNSGVTASSLTSLGTITTGTWTGTTIAAANGGTGQTAVTEDATLVANGSAFVSTVLPSCSGATTEKLLYNSSTNAFSCGTDQTTGGGAVTSVTATRGIFGTPSTGAVGILRIQTTNAQTGTSYTLVSSDLALAVSSNNGSSVAWSLPQATGTFTTGAFMVLRNIGAGALTITPTTSTIGGSATLVLEQGEWAAIESDGTNWLITETNKITAGTGITLTRSANSTALSVNQAALTLSSLGGSVTDAQVPNTITVDLAAAATALAANPTDCSTNQPAVGINASGTASCATIVPSTYGGTGNGFTKFSGPTSTEKTFTLPDASSTLTITVASGTASLNTSAITANACATLVTVSATGVASTDAIQATPNADISAVTGYGKASTDGLIIYPYPTANNVNFNVCNGTGSSITPGAVTLNWRVVR